MIDRTQLIIEIFGLRASSKEGKLQVELASLNFQKPDWLDLGLILKDKEEVLVFWEDPEKDKLKLIKG